MLHLTGRSARVFPAWLESSKGVDLPEGCRDLDDFVLTIWISLPVLDVPFSDKDVDPQPRDEVDP
ncbi:hypothetical protein AAII07_45865 [Microvirga sp. 0TCS3.31]